MATIIAKGNKFVGTKYGDYAKSTIANEIFDLKDSDYSKTGSEEKNYIDFTGNFGNDTVLLKSTNGCSDNYLKFQSLDNLTYTKKGNNLVITQVVIDPEVPAVYKGKGDVYREKDCTISIAKDKMSYKGVLSEIEYNDYSGSDKEYYKFVNIKGVAYYYNPNNYVEKEIVSTVTVKDYFIKDSGIYLYVTDGLNKYDVDTDIESWVTWNSKGTVATGTNRDDYVESTSNNETFDLKKGWDIIDFTNSYTGNDIVKLGKDEGLLLKFKKNDVFNFNKSKNDLIIYRTSENPESESPEQINSQITIKNYFSYKDSNVWVEVEGEGDIESKNLNEIISEKVKDGWLWNSKHTVATGTNLDDYAISTSANESFNLKGSSFLVGDTIDFSAQNIGKDTVVLNNQYYLNLEFNEEDELSYEKIKNNLIITKINNEIKSSITLKDYFKKEGVLFINGNDLIDAVYRDSWVWNSNHTKATGSVIDDYVFSTEADEIFELKDGYDTIDFNLSSENLTFGNDTIILGKYETLQLNLNISEDLKDSVTVDKQIVGKDLVISAIVDEIKSTITVKNGAIIKTPSNGCYSEIHLNNEKKIFSDYLYEGVINEKTGKGIGTARSEVFNAGEWETDSGVKGVNINSGAGNDEITGSGYNDTITSSSGDNTINEFGGKNIITTGAGIDTITVSDSINTINAGNGENSICIEGYSNVFECDENDFLKGWYTNIITTGKNDDYVEIRGGINKISTGAGDDYIAVIDASTSERFSSVSDTEINGGAGDDVYDLTALTSSYIEITDNSGIDQVLFDNTVKFSDSDATSGNIYSIFFDVTKSKKIGNEFFLLKDFDSQADSMLTMFESDSDEIDLSLVGVGIESSVKKSSIENFVVKGEENGDSVYAINIDGVNKLVEDVQSWLVNNANGKYKSAMDVVDSANREDVMSLLDVYEAHTNDCFSCITVNI